MGSGEEREERERGGCSEVRGRSLKVIGQNHLMPSYYQLNYDHVTVIPYHAPSGPHSIVLSLGSRPGGDRPITAV